jgi:hypothetical protein
MFAAVIILMIVGILAIQGALSGLSDWIKDADFQDMEDEI